MEAFSELIALWPQLKAGEMTAAGGAVMLLVRIYRAFGGPWPGPGKKWIAQLVIGLVSFVSALLLGGFLGPVGWGAAAIQAAMIAVTAVTGHKVTAGLGKAVRTPQPYTPSPFRDASSLLVPPPVLRPDEILERNRRAGKGE